MWGASPPEVLLPCPCSWTSASHCACPQLQASPHGADEEAAALRKMGCAGEGSNLPLTKSSAAQRISCYFWGPLRECRPPTCLTKPQPMALFTERQRQVLICRTETASMVFSCFLLFLWRMCLHQTWGCTVRRKEATFPV